MSQAEPNTKPRVLVVEDDLDTRDLLTLILEDEGYQVDALDDGRKVAGHVRSVRPDVITLDIGLPGMSGSAVLDDLERDPVTAGIPVIVISGHTRKLGDPDREHATRVIAKPFYITQVVDEIERVLARPAQAS